MKQTGYVYRVTNLINGMVYIGQRREEFQSWYLGSGMLIRRAVAKHGAQNFSLEFLQSAFSQDDLDTLEAFFIAESRRAGRTYNVRDGGLGSLFNGKGPNHGKKHSAETRAMMVKAHSGDRNHYYGRGYLLAGSGNPMFGRKHSEETKRKISAKLNGCGGPNHGNRGKKRSPEMIEAMRTRALAQQAAYREAKK